MNIIDTAHQLLCNADAQLYEECVLNKGAGGVRATQTNLVR